MTLTSRAWLVALCAAAGVACSESPPTQVITGRVSTSAIAVRAVSGTNVVAAAAVRSDGSFTIALPKGQTYRLEVLSSAGVHHVLKYEGGTAHDLAFTVCEPQQPFDCGDIGPDAGMGGGGTSCDPMTDPSCVPCDPMSDPNCKPAECMADGTCCQPGDLNCGWPCDPMTDPMCGQPCDPMSDPSCGKCDPLTDPTCGQPCDAMTDPNCQPPTPCDPSDPMCKPWPPDCMADGSCGDPCQPGDPNCDPPPPPVCMDPTDPYCKCDANGMCPPDDCDPATNLMCPPPPPAPCTDPMDIETCKDPCVADPMTCGCAMGDPNCWPSPEPPTCDANGACQGNGMGPQFPPGDFGCGEMP